MVTRARTRSPMVIVVAAIDVPVYRAILRSWQRLQAEDSRVPDVVVDLTPGRASSCTSVGWADETRIVEVNLRPDGQTGPTLTGAELMTWLMHQASHGVVGPVTGQEGRYHGPAYRDAAEGLGLEVEKAPTGYGATTLAPGTRTRYRPEIAALDRALASWSPTDQVKATRDSRNGVAAACSCAPPRRIRMRGKDAERVFDLGPIRCEVCGQPFTLVPQSARVSSGRGS